MSWGTRLFMRNALRRLLWTGLVLAAMLVLTGGCWAWLRAVGDRGAAEGVRGVLFVTLAAFVADTLALVAVLAYAELKRSSGSPAGGTSLESRASTE